MNQFKTALRFLPRSKYHRLIMRDDDYIAFYTRKGYIIITYELNCYVSFDSCQIRRRFLDHLNTKHIPFETPNNSFRATFVYKPGREKSLFKALELIL